MCKVNAREHNMSKTYTVAAKDLPLVLNVLLRKQHVDVTLTDTVEIHACDMQWTGGARYAYALVELATGIVKPITLAVKFTLPPGFVVVQTGTFCGKPSSGHVYANIADVASALPKARPELPFGLKQVLCAVSSYNSKGKERFRLDFNMGRQEWEQYIAQLVELGLCNKNGSLTVEGKNTARTIDSLIINPYSDKSRG